MILGQLGVLAELPLLCSLVVPGSLLNCSLSEYLKI